MFQLPHHNSIYTPQKDGTMGVKPFTVQTNAQSALPHPGDLTPSSAAADSLECCAN